LETGSIKSKGIIKNLWEAVLTFLRLLYSRWYL
jgi:hypothetical protein